MSDTSQENQSEAGENLGGSPPSIQKPMTVSQAGLVLSRVRLTMLLCTRSDSAADMPSVIDLDSIGSYVKDSLTDSDFVASVTWTLKFGDDVKLPITLSGKHELTFSVGQPIDEMGARYYSEINAVILAYPYIRQVVDDLATKCLGRNLMIRPLDVPKFVAEKLKGFQNKIEPSKSVQQGETLSADQDNRE